MARREGITTLCYLERGDEYLMMHRISKKNDINKDKWIGVGGHFEGTESPEECVKREVFEETGVKMEVKRLIAVHENYFYGDVPTNQGKLIYEVSFYFQMDVPEEFQPVCDSVNEAGDKEYLRWVSPDTPMTIYPEFFRKEAVEPSDGVFFTTTDERIERTGKC